MSAQCTLSRCTTSVIYPNVNMGPLEILGSMLRCVKFWSNCRRPACVRVGSSAQSRSDKQEQGSNVRREMEGWEGRRCGFACRGRDASSSRRAGVRCGRDNWRGRTAQRKRS